MSDNGGWRADTSLKRTVVYKKKFAILPKTCSDGSRVWLREYFNKYEIWKHELDTQKNCGHIDFVESITEQEYVIRKLTETP